MVISTFLNRLTNLFQVQIGDASFVVGYLTYDENLWDYAPFRYGVIVAAGALLFLIIIIIFVCLCKKVKKQKQKNDNIPDDKKSLSLYETKQRISFISAYAGGE